MKRKTEQLTFEGVLGMADILQAQMAASVQNVATGLMTLAKQLDSVDKFLSGASTAENERRVRLNEEATAQHWSEEERRMRSRLPQSWSNAKSQIKRLWQEFGVHPREFETYYALRAKLLEMRQKARPPSAYSAQAPEPNTEVGRAVRGMLHRLEGLPEEYQLRVVESASRLIDTYEDAAQRLEKIAEPQRIAATH